MFINYCFKNLVPSVNNVKVYKLIKVTVYELEVTVTFENVIKGNYSIEYPGPFLNNN